MLVNITANAVTFSSYSCPFIYIPEVFLGLSWGYYQAYSSYKIRFGGESNILNESGLVSAPFIVDVWQKNISNSYVGLTAYWLGGVSNYKYREFFLMDRLTETFTLKKDHNLLKNTILPYVFRSFRNYTLKPDLHLEDDKAKQLDLD